MNPRFTTCARAFVASALLLFSGLAGAESFRIGGTGASVAKRFGYAFVAPEGTATPAGPAPYLDCVAAPDTDYTQKIRQADWLAGVPRLDLGDLLGAPLHGVGEAEHGQAALGGRGVPPRLEGGGGDV